MAKLKSLLRQKIKEALDFSPKENWALQHDGSVLHVSSRSYSKIVKVNGTEYVKKIFCRHGDARASFQVEFFAQEIFSEMPWVTPIKKKGQTCLGQPFFLCEKHPFASRVDRLALDLTSDERFEVALAALSVVLDMHTQQVAHRDFQATNLFYYNKTIKVVDFETMMVYPDNYRPDFCDCYDLTGNGLPSPFLTKNMGFFKEHSYSVYGVLRVPPDVLLPVLKEEVLRDFNHAVSLCDSLTENELHHARDLCAAGRHAEPMHKSFANPCTDISEILRGIDNQRVLLVGNSCLRLFSQIMEKAPAQVVFFDPSGATVRQARRYAGINDFHHVFVHKGGIHEIMQSDYSGEPFDVVIVGPITRGRDASDYRMLKPLASGSLFVLGGTD